MPGDLVGEYADVVHDRPQFLRQFVDVGGGLGEFVVDLRIADEPAERAFRFVERAGEEHGLLQHLVEPADGLVDLGDHRLACARRAGG